MRDGFGMPITFVWFADRGSFCTLFLQKEKGVVSWKPSMFGQQRGIYP